MGKPEAIEPKCKEKLERGETDWNVDFCYNSRCHYCDDPYSCTIPHYLKHLLGIEHEEDE